MKNNYSTTKTIIGIKSVILKHGKNALKLSKTIRQAEKISHTGSGKISG